MPYRQRLLKRTYSSGLTSLSPIGTVTTDDLKILPNAVDTNPYITLYGGGAVYVNANGSYIYIQDSGSSYLGIAKTGATTVTIAGFLTNADISIVPNGSGLLKYGVKTAHADQAIDGYITFKLADGTTAYLATLTPT